jgi:ABC-type glutathione transport system ATPase component
MSILKVENLTVAFPLNISEEEAANNPVYTDHILRPRGRFVKKNRPYKKILHSVSFDMKKREILGLVGESGSGKSMISLAISGLLPEGVEVVDGRVLFEGVELLHMPEKEMRKMYRGKRISTLFQDAKGIFVPSRSIGPQIAEMLVMHMNMSRKEAKLGAVELLREANISNPENSYDKIISELSGGEAQRASIAMMALSTKPDLLIADEATTALDVTVQKKTLDYLMKVVREKGISLLFITHDFGLVAEYADRVVVIDDGRVVEIGDVKRIFTEPRSEFLKRVLADLPRIDRPLREKMPLEQMSEKVIDVSDLRVSFSATEHRGMFRRGIVTTDAVDNVSIRLYRGEILGIVGESGSGKTTLMRGILKVLPEKADTEGDVIVFGQDMYALSEKDLLLLRRKINGVPQSSSQGLTPGKRVRDLVGEPLDIHDLYESKRAYEREEEKTRRVAELLSAVEIPSSREREVIGRFSGGEQQRIAIASALATDPAVLMLDEPTASLDASLKNTILELLIKLHKERALSLIIISHELPIIASICDRVVVMWKGRVVETGTPAAVFGNPLHPYTKRLVSSVPIPDPHLARERDKIEGDINLHYELSDSILVEEEAGHFVMK